MQSVADRARARILQAMSERSLSQKDVADLLHWTPSKVQKILTGPVDLTVDAIEALASAVGLTIVDVVRDPHFEFVADMTPTEYAYHKRLQQLTDRQREALLTLLNIRPPVRQAAEPRKKTVHRG